MPIGRNGFIKAKGTNIEKLISTIKEEIKTKECNQTKLEAAKKNPANRKYIKF